MSARRSERRVRVADASVAEELLKVDPPLFHLPLYRSLASMLLEGSHDAESGARRSITLTLWHDGSAWRCSLHDKGRRIVAFLRDEDPFRLLCTLDAGLDTETLLWKPDGSQQ